MLFLHPVIQGTCIVLAAVALVLGLQRARSLHLGHPVRFRRRAHVLVGKLAIGGLLAGMLTGLTMTYLTWGQVFMTSGHGRSGVAIAPLLLFGAVTGWILETRKKKRVVLPVLHGVANAGALLLALNQLRTGIGVLRTFVFDL